jgi:hypothetical protein
MTNLDFLESHVGHQGEQNVLAVRVYRLGKRLIAVSQARFPRLPGAAFLVRYCRRRNGHGFRRSLNGDIFDPGKPCPRADSGGSYSREDQLNSSKPSLLLQPA